VSFLVPCPLCGPRDVYEFRWGGAQSQRPAPDAPREDWVDYLYLRDNVAGVQREWWYHRLGCRRWFLGIRDTRTNALAQTFWPPGPGLAEPAGELSTEP
jgi:sarcosine oxidase subunit delta